MKTGGIQRLFNYMLSYTYSHALQQFSVLEYFYFAVTSKNPNDSLGRENNCESEEDNCLPKQLKEKSTLFYTANIDMMS